MKTEGHRFVIKIWILIPTLGRRDCNKKRHINRQSGSKFCCELGGCRQRLLSGKRETLETSAMNSSVKR